MSSTRLAAPTALGMLSTMLADTARFHPDDPEILVTASLACPTCLRSDDVQWDAALDGYDPFVECHCPSCEHTWRVYLAPFQALRLGLMHTRIR